VKLSADYNSYDDESLIRLIAQLRGEALDQLYERYSRLIYGLAMMIVGDRSIAEEITLDVFMRVWQKAAIYRPDQAKVSTWLTHIARNHSIDVLRRQAVRLDRSALSLEEVFSDDLVNPQDTQELAEGSLRRERVRTAVSQLPAEQKQALLLAYFGGYTQAQIADILEQPLGTVKTRIRLAMQKLRDLLGEEQEFVDESAQAINSYNLSDRNQ
jgi:RNA polymerase sigma-70 factor, ECF subfamily